MHRSFLNETAQSVQDSSGKYGDRLTPDVRFSSCHFGLYVVGHLKVRAESMLDLVIADKDQWLRPPSGLCDIGSEQRIDLDQGFESLLEGIRLLEQEADVHAHVHRQRLHAGF